MITFYPRDIQLWRNYFHFGIELLSSNKTFEQFLTKEDFFDFLKLHGIKLDDSKYPLQFFSMNHHKFGPVDSVVQWSVIGWCKWI